MPQHKSKQKNRRSRVLVRGCYNRRHGAQAVEMAFAIPILFLLVFGGYEAARANLTRNVASTAAYEGARCLVVAGASASDADPVVANVLNTMGMSGATITVTPSAITPLTPSVHVRVEIPFASSTGFSPSFFDGLALSGECQLTREGF